MALAAADFDVMYVLTGKRSGSSTEALTAEEQTMLGYFREASKEVRRAALGALLGAAAPAAATTTTKTKPAQSAAGFGMNNSGAGAVQVGHAQVFNAPISGGVAGRKIVNKGK